MTAAALYSIRRRHLLEDLRFWRRRGHGLESLRQLRMELAAHRHCRAMEV